MKYLLLAVGCIECGCATFPVSWHKTKKGADKALSECPDWWHTFGGDGYFTVWKVGKKQIIKNHAIERG